MGLSMGGTLALRLAEQHPEIVKRPRPRQPVAALATTRALKALPAAQGIRPVGQGRVERHRQAGPGRGGVRPHAAEGALLPHEALADHHDDLATVKAPLLVYRSDQDHVVEESSCQPAPRPGRVHRGRAPRPRPQLPRRDPRLRRRTDLRRLLGVPTRARPGWRQADRPCATTASMRPPGSCWRTSTLGWLTPRSTRCAARASRPTPTRTRASAAPISTSAPNPVPTDQLYVDAAASDRAREVLVALDEAPETEPEEREDLDSSAIDAEFARIIAGLDAPAEVEPAAPLVIPEEKLRRSSRRSTSSRLHLHRSPAATP